ncbi:MAG: hypothetical protein IBX71_00935 [Candidatus Desulforudis sp.]|nr:hypothetical protein [Desulforudis sp.]
MHNHIYLVVTGVSQGHTHCIGGVTGEPIVEAYSHVHEITPTTTTYDQSHLHWLALRTGPAIRLTGGGHVHAFEGITGTGVPEDPAHAHFFEGISGLGPDPDSAT